MLPTDYRASAFRPNYPEPHPAHVFVEESSIFRSANDVLHAVYLAIPIVGDISSTKKRIRSDIADGEEISDSRIGVKRQSEEHSGGQCQRLEGGFQTSMALSSSLRPIRSIKPLRHHKEDI